jgi:hypothetical protein
MADGLDQALCEEVSTKSDLAVLKAAIAAVRNEVDLLQVEIKSDPGVLKGELLAAITA